MNNTIRSGNTACPCGSGKETGKCCFPVISGDCKALNPEQLMRSRYTAYATGNTSYILQTWHSSTRPAELALEGALYWTGLRVVKSLPVNRGGDEEGYVEFIARYQRGLETGQLHERSRFLQELGEWRYVDGIQFGPSEVIPGSKLGRNDPCHCGSGKKYKKCCG